MKKTSIAAIIVSTLLVVGGLSSVAVARPGNGQDCGDRQERREMKHEQRMEMMAELLELSDAQQEQISAIHEKKRTDMAAVREQMQAGREQMRALVEAETFDEAAVRSLATSQATLKADMMVAKAKVKHEVFSLLTAEQQEKAKKFEPMLQGKKRHHRSGKGI